MAKNFTQIFAKKNLCKFVLTQIFEQIIEQKFARIFFKRKFFANDWAKICANIFEIQKIVQIFAQIKAKKIIMRQMFSQLFVQIFALYKFFRKNLRKKVANFLWILYEIWLQCDEKFI